MHQLSKDPARGSAAKPYKCPIHPYPGECLQATSCYPSEQLAHFPLTLDWVTASEMLHLTPANNLRRICVPINSSRTRFGS